MNKEIVEWSKRDPGVKKTNRNGWHSTTEMHQDDLYLEPLVNELFINDAMIYGKKNG